MSRRKKAQERSGSADNLCDDCQLNFGMSLCTCGHTQEEHLSSDGLDHSCQVDECGCSNYGEPTEEQKKRFAQLGWIGDTDRQDSSNSGTQKSHEEGHPAPEDHEQHAEVKISDIKVGNRFRKDPGNIDDLVESIRKNGLLCPVTVTKDYLLIDGLRRIEACKKLNIPVIPVHIVDLPIKENGEIDANLVRKDFSIEEKVAIKRYRESIEPNLQGQCNDLELLGNFPRSDNKQRRDERIAESTGVSYKTSQKMEEIVDAAQRNPQKFGPLLRKIDSGQTNVSKASKIIENENKKLEILEKARAQDTYNNDNDNLKLFRGDFRDVCRKEVPDDSI